MEKLTFEQESKIRMEDLALPCFWRFIRTPHSEIRIQESPSEIHFHGSSKGWVGYRLKSCKARELAESKGIFCLSDKYV